ncbi:unnamed protein product, partial [Rotaria socialis]
IVTMARPWSNDDHQGFNGHKLITYRVPNRIRVPAFMTQTLQHSRAMFTAENHIYGQRLLINLTLILETKHSGSDSNARIKPKQNKVAVRFPFRKKT